MSPISESPFLRVIRAAGAISHAGGPGAVPADTSLEEERREVLESVLEAVSRNPPDADEMAACRHLLMRLAETAGRPGRQSA